MLARYWRGARLLLDSLNFFLWPTILAVLTAIVLMIGGMHPWEDVSYFYSLMAIALSVLVAATVVGGPGAVAVSSPAKLARTFSKV